MLFPLAPWGQLVSMNGMLRIVSVLGLICALLTACEPTDKSIEYGDDRNPYFKAAEKHIKEFDYASAAQDYENALQANPKLAVAHFELGQLYGDKLGDLINAMYHLNKFLVMDPNSPDHEKAQAYLDRAKISFAAMLPNSPVQNAEVFAKLQGDYQVAVKQHQEDSKKIADLEARLNGGSSAPVVETTPPPTASSTATNSPSVTLNPPVASTNMVPGSAVAPATSTVAPHVATATNAPAATGAPRSYTVKSGDSLWKIASKMYPGDTKNGVEKIKAANAATLGDGTRLKIGQTLVIP